MMKTKIKNALISVSDKENLIPLLKVPPELMILMLNLLSDFNNGIKFSLSDTEIRAFFILVFVIKFFS